MRAERPCTAELSDAAVQRRLAAYRRAGSLCAFGAVLCTAACAALLLLFRAKLPAAALFAAAALCILAAAGVRKKQRTLLEETLRGFFRAELERRFGPAPAAPELRIDRPLMEALFPPDGQWSELKVPDFCGGESGGARFSAAQVRLTRLVTVGNIHDGREKRPETVRRCLVLRLQVGVADLTEPLVGRLSAAAARLGTPLLAAVAESGCVTIALDTDFSPAPLPESALSADPAALRQRWTATLDALEQMLAAFREALT